MVPEARSASVHGREAFADKPDKKSEYSHPCDACAYGLLGAGEMRALQARDVPSRVTMRIARAPSDFSVI